MRVVPTLSLFFVACSTPDMEAHQLTPGADDALAMVTGSLSPVDGARPDGPWRGSELTELRDADGELICSVRQRLEGEPVRSDCVGCTLAISLLSAEVLGDGCALQGTAPRVGQILVYAPSDPEDGIVWLDAGAEFEAFGLASLRSDVLTWQRLIRIDVDGGVDDVSLRDLRGSDQQGDL